MRAGTQTLIQALQALPWTSSNSSDNEDDGQDSATGDDESEGEKPRRKQYFSIYHEPSPTYFLLLVKRLASSLHTIHRPFARSQRVPIPNAFNPSAHPPKKKRVDLDDTSSEEEIENDFEDTPRIAGAAPSQFIKDSATAEEGPAQEHGASLATIRLHRRMHLAEKLKQVFELDDIHEVLSGMHFVASIRLVS
jgi:sterol 3beta-glucosyltransferase